MNIVIYISFVCVFFLLTPGILFRVSKNKYISAFIHSVIFAIFCSLFLKNLEGLEEKKETEEEKKETEEEVITYLDSSCNTILNDSTPMFLIQKGKCISMNDYKE